MTTLYAEFLPNIQTLTITAVISTPRNQSTSLWLSNDHSKLILEHDDETHRIILPAKVPGQGSQHLRLPSTGETKCINRILAKADVLNDEVFIPWSAGALGPDTELWCKTCNAVISSSKVHVWKDLPSESWAEMMDLWHCHKPAEPDEPSDGPTKKGYAAGNRLIAKPGTGFVDVMSFLLAEEDCTGTQTQSTTDSDNEPPILICTTCNSPLGNSDPETSGLRLQKLSLTLSSSSSPSSPSRSYTPAQWFSTNLLSAIDTQGVRKFVFATLPLELWIFSTNLAFSSLHSPDPTPGIKVLYRQREGDGDVEILRKENLLIETLTLGPRLEKMLEGCLREQNGMLPESLRKFMDWEVAVLPRVVEADVR